MGNNHIDGRVRKQSGYVGIVWVPQNGKYIVTIRVRGIKQTLGHCVGLKDAIELQKKYQEFENIALTEIKEGETFER